MSSDELLKAARLAAWAHVEKEEPEFKRRLESRLKLELKNGAREEERRIGQAYLEGYIAGFEAAKGENR